MLPLRAQSLGFGSLMVETADTTIFRVPFREEAANGHAVELRLLPALAGELPIAIPNPCWYAEPGDLPLALGAIGYRKLAGAPLSARTATRAVARDLAGALRALHSSTLLDLAPRVPRWRDRVSALDAYVSILQRNLTRAERATLRRWWKDALRDDEMDDGPRTLRHGDLWYENVLVDGDPARLAGIVDWEAAAVGDPAEDFAPLSYLGDEFATAVLGAYDGDSDLRHRARRYSELREFAGLRWAVEQRDGAEFAEAVEKIRRSPIFA